MQLLTHDEAFAFLQDGQLPENFAERVGLLLEFTTCENCDEVHCMHFRMRDWWAPDFDDCDGFCCPSCGQWEKGRAAAEAVGAFLRRGTAPAAGRFAEPDAASLRNGAFDALGR
jgi:hypothetical protein